jgi:type II secretion system protein E
MSDSSKPLGELLLMRNIITEQQLSAALEDQKKSKRMLGQTLIELGFASEEQVLSVLAQQRQIPFVSIKGMQIDPEAVKAVKPKYAHHYMAMPISITNGTLQIALSDPFDLDTLDDLRLLLGCRIDPVLAGKKDIKEGLKRYYGIGADTVEKILDETTSVSDSGPADVGVEDLEELAHEASVVKFVNQILLEAFQERATDIHIEPFEDELRVRYRIDGILYDVSVPPNIRQFHSAIVSRIKIMANLNITEKRLPQDGRIKVKVGENELDLRISILPTPFGEAVDIRLLSRRDMFLGLEKLGLLSQDMDILESIIKKSHGIILVTGPTGSGKTTTLYACLSKINDSEKKIITIEDPIEYQLRGITQIQIFPKIGLTFSHGLRSMLRHDPDIMMVGEIRDLETAEIAIRVALTGHLVFSTVHTNDAASTITRLVNMGIEPYLISSSVVCIIAQRLVRLVCPGCKAEVPVTGDIVEQFELHPVSVPPKIFEGKGCEACRFTGYRGRTGIYEVLVINEKIRDLIDRKVPANRIKDEARTLGMRTLRQDGWEKVKRGLTTLSEVLRVTQEEADSE